MTEVFPIVAGFAVGALLTLIRSQTRLYVAALASVVLGTTATIVSGEYKIGWEFLIIDIPLVALSSAAGCAVVRPVRRLKLPSK